MEYKTSQKDRDRSKRWRKLHNTPEDIEHRKQLDRTRYWKSRNISKKWYYE